MRDTSEIRAEAQKAGISGLCACTSHNSGQGLAPCLGHATRIREHQAMYATLKELANGTAAQDPGEHASAVLDRIHYWHADHPLPTLDELRP